MDKLLTDIRALVDEEYARASAKFGPVNHSAHESYAVLLEEVEEAKDEPEALDEYLKKFWEAVKGDDLMAQKIKLRFVRTCATNAAAEYVQVAAMAKKALLSLEDEA